MQRPVQKLLKTVGVAFQKCRCNTSYVSGGLWEPPYLEGMKSKVPLLETINIQMKGYDYPILESYHRLVHNIVTNMDIAVEESWATPPQKLKVTTVKPNSSVTEHDYTLHMYERNIQISDVESTLYSVLLSAINASVPEGVTVKVLEHTPEQELVRFVPDLELKDLKDQLTQLGGPTVERKKRK